MPKHLPRPAALGAAGGGDVFEIYFILFLPIVGVAVT